MAVLTSMIAMLILTATHILGDSTETFLPIVFNGYQSGTIVPTAQPEPTPTSCIATLEFTYVPAYNSLDDLKGTTTCVPTTNYGVAVYIYVSGWWTKPTFQQPVTELNADGTWITDITTGGLDHQATAIAAFLIPVNYEPPVLSGAAQLPSELSENAVAEETISRASERRTINFSGYSWVVKESDVVNVAPGPNYFSDNEEDVFVDEDGRLHLKISYRDGKWYSSEVINTESFGYGTYRLTIGQVLSLDYNVVLGFFTWDDAASEDNHREIDVEISQWGDPNNDNAQFVVQPYILPGNMFRFEISEEVSGSRHEIEWAEDEIAFTSIDVSNPEAEDSIASWVYTGSSIPSAENETVRINLWLVDGQPPSDSSAVEVIFESFEFIESS